MAFRDAGHRLQVFQSAEYLRMVREYVSQGAPVPLAVFQENFGRAFFNNHGKPIRPSQTMTSRRAFLNIMNWTGRLPEDVETWDEWIEYNGYD